MRLHQLTEAATAVLYHSTTPDVAIEILKSGQFLLSDSNEDKSEMVLVPRKGWHFFLSTARTLFNVFVNDLATGDAVTFKMNGSWFNTQGYIVCPVNPLTKRIISGNTGCSSPSLIPLYSGCTSTQITE